MLAAVRADGDVLLERRPERGIWGGLWCLPEFASAAAAADYAQQMLRDAGARPVPLAPVEHAFTHFDLVITPLLAHCSGSARTPDPAQSQWYRARAPARLGLPAPIRLLLEQLTGAAAHRRNYNRNCSIDWRTIVARMVQCVMLKREAPGLDRPPYPGELGRRIYESVSRDAWARWLQQQTMLINEYRLTPIEPKARKFLEAEMEKFFFGGGSSKPEGYKAPGSEE